MRGRQIGKAIVGTLLSLVLACTPARQIQPKEEIEQPVQGHTGSGYVTEAEKAELIKDPWLKKVITVAEQNGYKLYRSHQNSKGSIDALIFGGVHNNFYHDANKLIVESVARGGELMLGEDPCDNTWDLDTVYGVNVKEHDFDVFGWDLPQSHHVEYRISLGRILMASEVSYKIKNNKPFTDFDKWFLYEELAICKEGEMPTRLQVLSAGMEAGSKADAVRPARNMSLAKHIIQYSDRSLHVTAGSNHIDEERDQEHYNDTALNVIEQADVGYLAFTPFRKARPPVQKGGETPPPILKPDKELPLQKGERPHVFHILGLYVEAAAKQGKKFEGKITYTSDRK